MNSKQNENNIKNNFNNITEQINNFNISNNSLQPTQLSTGFDFYKDFELRDMMGDNTDIEPNFKTNNQTNIINEDIQKIEDDIQKIENDTQKISEKMTNISELDKMINSLPFINDNLRSNITLSIELYKKLNNFDYNYIHNYFNEISNNK